MNKFKKDQLVIVISGRDKGKTGKITHVDTKNYKLLIENINIVKKAVKPDQNQKGGIVDVPRFIDQSNVLHYSDKKKIKSKIKIEVKKEQKVRVLKKTSEVLG